MSALVSGPRHRQFVESGPGNNQECECQSQLRLASIQLCPTMIKYTLYIPAGCFYTQLKVFIGVKSTMNCNPSCPAATLLASLDCAYLYWPPPHRLLACFMSLSTFPLLFQTLTFDEPVNDNASSTEKLSVVVLNTTSLKFVSLILPCYVCAFSYKFTS